MKKVTLVLLTAFMLATIIPTQLKAETEATPVSNPASKPAESAEVNAIMARLNEIKAMDKSNLSAAEKKELRKEVRTSKSYLKERGGGVYLTVGALIIVILLLILLL